MVFKMGYSQPLFLYFLLFFNSIVQMVDKILPMTGFKPLGSLVLEATALPTEPPSLPFLMVFFVLPFPNYKLMFAH